MRLSFCRAVIIKLKDVLSSNLVEKFHDAHYLKKKKKNMLLIAASALHSPWVPGFPKQGWATRGVALECISP